MNQEMSLERPGTSSMAASPEMLPVPSDEMKAVLDLLAQRKRGQPNRYRVPFEEGRQALVEERRWWIETAPAMASVEETTMQVEGRTVRLRRNVPHGANPEKELVYLHGGGWCVGSIETHDAIVRGIADACRHPVTALDYSLAPEYPFPAAGSDLRQVLTALRAASRASTRWILAGDSAGANLALLEAMRARDAREAMPDGLLLLYGTYLPVRPTHSMIAFGDGRYGLSKEAMLRYESAYLAGRIGDSVPQAFPLFGSLRGLPPMLIAAAELDPLYDDSVRLHQTVQDYGGRSVFQCYRGVVHGFLTYGRMMNAPREAFLDMAAFLDRLDAMSEKEPVQ